MIRVAVSGAGGRLGARVVERCLRAADVELVGALVRPGSSLEGTEIPGGAGSRYRSDVDGALGRADVLVEAALAATALHHAERSVEHGRAIVVATTGFDRVGRRALERHAERIPVLIAPNLSLGVTVLTDLVQRAARALAHYDLEVLELHHRHKRDAPSGTAWALAQAAAAARGRDAERDAIMARAGETGPRGDHELGVMALRGGSVVGEHTVFLLGETERLELTHRASSRDAFADGALAAARFMGAPGRLPGTYRMEDVLGLSD